ncbi:MAG TPA: helix-turn-helix transcriptional regulator [Xanthobacteraceae bacterium]|nr:helix-turn-helix transcriptional regulator [Xanthobacteraceae bacterium]
MAVSTAELSERDLRSAMGALQSLADQSADCESFVRAALEQLTGVVASDLTTLSICDLARGSRRVISRKTETLSTADRTAFDLHFREHPLVRFHGSHPGGPTQRISDCVSAKAFRNSALHADYYRRIGINHVMALPLWIDQENVISIVFNRGRADFKDGERAVLDAVRRPLAAMYRNLVACEEAGIGLKRVSRLASDGGWLLMQVGTSGRILDAPPEALRLLQKFFPRNSTEGGARIPEALSEWLSRSRNWGLVRPAIDGGEKFTSARLGVKLTVHFVPDTHCPSCGYLLMKSERLQQRAVDLQRLPVTEREREILALVAIGKTNAEIASVLTISPRTVQKHLEHIFQKLGVETRTAAAIRALEVTDSHSASAA